MLIDTCEPHVHENDVSPPTDLLDFSMDDSEARIWGVNHQFGNSSLCHQNDNESPNLAQFEDQMKEFDKSLEVLGVPMEKEVYQSSPLPTMSSTDLTSESSEAQAPKTTLP